MKTLLAAVMLLVPAFTAGPAAAAPRIVNLYNFVRNSDYRVPDAEQTLFDTTRQQMQLIHAAHLPATWALQYDALINPAYQKLFKEHASPDDEIAAWWELPRPLVEKAGLAWRGEHDWDSTANIGFSPGYTPAERRKLVDVYMADFKAIFGKYPATVGSWYIDEVTLAYMLDRYHIVASCNCKDQFGTDGYTLWGGYWNQAYYPSKLNAYMPAQTAGGQIDVPIFRMLGSDPIDQYDQTHGMCTLEPVYPNAGGSAVWTNWFFDSFALQPCLAFGYTQAGQENSFGWDAMKFGLTQQVAALAARVKAGQITVQTLADSGRWFRSHHPLTPATAVVALDDASHHGRRSVWYDGRFYRLNLLWTGDALVLRDLHRFDEKLASTSHDTPLQAKSLTCTTLPVMDGALWTTRQQSAGGYFVRRMTDDSAPLKVDGPPTVTEPSSTELLITQRLSNTGGGVLTLRCGETTVECSAVNADGIALPWAIELRGVKAAVASVTPTTITYRPANGGTPYTLTLSAGHCTQKANGDVRLDADSAGKLMLVANDRTSSRSRL